MKKIIFVILLFAHLVSIANEKENPRKRIHQYNTGKYTKDDIIAEIKFGRKLAASILGKYKISKNKKTNKYINTLGSAIVSYIGRPEIKYHFAVLKTKDINAYACPGGYIFITEGALQLMDNESQLVGVLAHEIAHVNQRHIVKQLKIKGDDDSLNASMAQLIGGQSTAIFKFLEHGMKLLFKSGLKKNDEFESDLISLEIMATFGYNVSSYMSFLYKVQKNQNQSTGKVLSATHPKMKTRLVKIKHIINKNKLTHKKTNTKRFKKNANI